MINQVSLSIDDPREDITETEIKTAMELVVSKNIFAPGGSDIAKAVSAKVVVTDTTDLRFSFIKFASLERRVGETFHFANDISSFSL